MSSSGRSPGMRHRLEMMDPEERKKLGPQIQYDRHVGKKQQERFRRQREALLRKQSKKHFGVAVRPDGRTEAGLIIPGVTERV